MKQVTSDNYRRRLIKVIDYIHDHLESDLSINALADIAMMSPYHFHRVYRGLVQETVNATIRRLRLQRAAVELIRSNQAISHIAKQVCYSSPEAFSRAFSQQFSETPKEYRESRQNQETALEPFIAMLPKEKKEYSTMYDVKIMELEAIDLMGYKHQGDYMQIGLVFEKLFVYAASHQLIENKTRSIGIYYDDPQSVAPDKLRSMACITNKQEADLAEANELERIIIPKGRYATVLFKGSYAELEKPYNWFFGEWLPNSGYEAADFPPFEEYLNDPKNTSPSNLLTRIHCLLV